MPSSNDICVLIDDSILSTHHGVRRYLMSLCSTLQTQGHNVYLIDSTSPNHRAALALDRALLVDNGFLGNRLIGTSRSDILKFICAGSAEKLKHAPTRTDIRREPNSKCPPRFDLCIVGAPWIIVSDFKPPKADRYVCIAYDAIPNLYYFNHPQDTGLHSFAHMHYRGYRWADEEANGIYCISQSTASQCAMFGFGQRYGLSVLPPMIPPGYLTLDTARVKTPRGRVALLAAPFDRRKGLLSMPRLVNAGRFDSLRIFGRPRCSQEELVNFFENIEIENIEWWCDVDFEKQVDLYLSSKVLLFPSLNEGLGFPLLEAYACGTSVLTTDTDPLRQLVLGEDLLSADDATREAQVLTRANEEVSPMKYRRFVDILCSNYSLGLVQEKI